MRVALRKLPGVDSVDVSLNRGLATVWLAPDNRITVDRIRNEIRESGFTPREADIQATGRILSRNGGFVLESGAESFDLAPPDRPDLATVLGRLAGGRARVEGSVPEAGKGALSPSRLRVRTVRAERPGEADRAGHRAASARQAPFLRRTSLRLFPPRQGV